MTHIYKDNQFKVLLMNWISNNETRSSTAIEQSDLADLCDKAFY